MRLTLAVLVLAALSVAAKADPASAPRVIEITKDNAERSTSVIANAKNPLIGMPPPSKIVRAASQWRNSRAEMQSQPVGPKMVDVSGFYDDTKQGRAQVQIITHRKTGTVAQTYFVPKHEDVFAVETNERR